MNKLNNLVIVLSFFLFFTILIIFIFNFIFKKNDLQNTYEDDLVNSENKVFVSQIPHEDENKNVTITPYGCFTELKNQFFQERVNPYSKDNNKLSSSYYISESEQQKDLKKLIQDVIHNGYTKFGNTILRKYNKSGSKGITILEVAKLAKLNGYNYISILKGPNSTHSYSKIYLTYTPPTISSAIYKYSANFTEDEFNSILTDSDLPDYSLTPKLNNFTNENDSGQTKELACGLPCITDNKPETFTDSSGVVRQYMCGSVNYPTLKTPERYAVYKIN